MVLGGLLRRRHQGGEWPGDASASRRCGLHRNAESSHLEFQYDISKLPGPVPSKLPQLLSFQDHISQPGGSTPEMDCVREHWLGQLLPERSVFEAPERPPDRCSRVSDPGSP
mmetsp:Transcript_73606/g.239597  ORF Transcript_73606/g.239597 Transcript_73606/m.239597 type:complete len:112 (-) Transcript_73606:36-371(-)